MLSETRDCARSVRIREKRSHGRTDMHADCLLAVLKRQHGDEAVGRSAAARVSECKKLDQVLVDRRLLDRRRLAGQYRRRWSAPSQQKPASRWQTYRRFSATISQPSCNHFGTIWQPKEPSDR